MKVLVSNVGSTSLKCKLLEMPQEIVLCEAKIDRIGGMEPGSYFYCRFSDGVTQMVKSVAVPTYSVAIGLVLNSMIGTGSGVIAELSQIEAVGFKTVLARGYYGVHELTDPVLDAMREFLPVAPAHNGPYLEAIAHFRSLLPGAKLVGVFETAFHTTIPLHRRLYAVPYEWYARYGIMRMGYHGASCSYAADVLTDRFGENYKAITCHLGGSSSLCAIENGKSIDSSFGFSLQTGIPHANRSGDLDGFLFTFLQREGLSWDEIETALSKNSGLLGISGVSNDLREILAVEDENDRAKLAVSVFVTAIVRYIGSFYAEMGGLDYLVFTGGIGENSAEIRKRVCDAVAHMGIALDEEKNKAKSSGIREISRFGSSVKVLVVPANEELGVARKTYALLT